MKKPVLISIGIFFFFIATMLWLNWNSVPSPLSSTSTFSLNETLGEPPEDFSYQSLSSPPSLRFPEDHADHPEFRNEWWYFTGNLKDPSGKEYGYQLTVFRNRLPKQEGKNASWEGDQIYMGHFGFTDVEKKQFYSEEVFEREQNGLVGVRRDPLKIRIYRRFLIEGPSPSNDSKIWKISAKFAGVELNLDLHPIAPLTLQGDRGYSRKGKNPSNASAYYSIPRLLSKGQAKLGGRTIELEGQSWFDREWSTSALDKGTTGWDWFAIQFEDASELMLYRLRMKDGSQSPFSYGLYRTDEGNRILGASDFSLNTLEKWRSPSSGIEYPSVFQAEIPALGMVFVSKPKIPNQEHTFAFKYWEGAISIKADYGNQTLNGQGYLEMTGY